MPTAPLIWGYSDPLIYYAFLSDYSAPITFNTLLRTFCAANEVGKELKLMGMGTSSPAPLYYRKAHFHPVAACLHRHPHNAASHPARFPRQYTPHEKPNLVLSVFR